MDSKVPDTHGLQGASIFINWTGNNCIYPHKKELHSSQDLMSFIHKVGVPQTLVSDGAKVLTQGDTRDMLNEYQTQNKIMVPYSPWQNAAKESVCECKKGICNTTHRANAPRQTQAYHRKWVTAIKQMTAHPAPKFNGYIPAEGIEGPMVNILAYAMFDWYKDVFCYETVQLVSLSEKIYGKLAGCHQICN